MRLRSKRVILLFAGECASHRHFWLRGDLTYPLQFAPGALINTAGSGNDFVGGTNDTNGCATGNSEAGIGPACAWENFVGTT